ncbi:hypothetical protein BO94DRAFT_620739 [Aspergillus sclerotioniger CBS 115572]|uniref:Uncharacterized protein n=1 Tax=Aspergillus sclerotioniger CBS 115572 TaxID=1450535 RepID=A0A317XCC6_9EURO|nr:hypothetical protein BO94DRAFT_620739 [Aspergillus sclerotioniger CBS 115572]PWY95267.1 hypothetical protein BO94DRAFT_620739 [Aspergillus sclerotioniger CBS 115572]
MDSTAAYVNGDDEAIPLVKIEGPPEYQEHMKQLLADSKIRRSYDDEIHILSNDHSTPSYSSDKSEMIAALLHQVKEQAAQYLHRPINITAYSLPRGLDTVSWNHLCDSVFETNVTSMDYRLYRSDYLDAVRDAYRLDTCAGFSLPESCDLYLKSHSIFFIDIGREGLVNLWVGYVDEYVVRIYDGQHVVTAYEYDESEEKSGLYRFQQILWAFIEDNFTYDMTESFGAVVLSGEAPQEEMHAMKQAIYLALPEEWRPLLRAVIDPSYVAAIGIARRIEKHIDRPCFREEDLLKSYMIDPPDYDMIVEMLDYTEYMEGANDYYLPGDEEYPFTSTGGCELS